MYLFFNGTVILKLSFGFIVKQILDVSRLSQPIYSIRLLALSKAFGDICAVMYLFICTKIENPIKTERFKALKMSIPR